MYPATPVSVVATLLQHPFISKQFLFSDIVLQNMFEMVPSQSRSRVYKADLAGYIFFLKYGRELFDVKMQVEYLQKTIQESFSKHLYFVQEAVGRLNQNHAKFN